MGIGSVYGGCFLWRGSSKLGYKIESIVVCFL